MMKPSDVVVIGAGIIGASTAYYLSRTGLSVTLVDRQGMLAGGTASQACAGGVRFQGRFPCEMPLALEAARIWADLEDELDADLEYRRGGMTIVTDREDLIPKMEERVSIEQSLGLDNRMVYGRDIYNLVPGLAPGMLAGSYCPLDGQASPLKTVAALVNAARKNGARLAWNTPVDSFEIDKGRLKAVKTPRGDIPCGRAILAAGAWSRGLAARLGLNLPFQSFGLQMMITPRRAHSLDQVLAWMGHGISLKQVPPGGFLIGGGWPGEINTSKYHTQLLPGSICKSAQTTINLYPYLAGLPILRSWVGIDAFSPDEMQVIGPVPEIEGLFLATGFSGHGFGIGPGVGSVMAEYLATDRFPDYFKPFIMDRFL